MKRDNCKGLQLFSIAILANPVQTVTTEPHRAASLWAYFPNVLDLCLENRIMALREPLSDTPPWVGLRFDSA
jgi:hypothetical protein